MNEPSDSNVENKIKQFPNPVAPNTITSKSNYRICNGCLKEISNTSNICPHCGTHKGYIRFVGKSLGWIAGLMILLNFIPDFREIVNLIVDPYQQNRMVTMQVKASEALREAKEYQAAWEQLDVAQKKLDNVESRPKDLVLARHNLARTWLLNARILGRESFKDIADLISPIIADATSTGSNLNQAENKAMLAYTQYLRARSEPIHANVVSLYRQALKIDPKCALAHLLMGHYLVGFNNDLDQGLKHLATAVDLKATTDQLGYISARTWQLTSISNYIMSIHYLDQEGFARWSPGASALLQVANEMRIKGEPLPLGNETDSHHRNRFWHRIQRLYKTALSDRDQFNNLLSAIPPEDHIATLEWLQNQHPDGILDPFLVYASARLHEQQGDTKAAVIAYRSTQPKHYRLTGIWDKALLRLTGQSARSLQERDPWAYRAQVMESNLPTDKIFTKVFDEVADYMTRHDQGIRRFGNEALVAVSAGIENIAKTNLGEAVFDDQGVLAELSLYRAKLLLAFERQDEALVTLDGWQDRLPIGSSIRSNILMTLAVAHAQNIETSKDPQTEKNKALALLKEAIEVEGYTNWARIRWFDDLSPLYSAPEYKSLLARHGRKVEWVFQESTNE